MEGSGDDRRKVSEVQEAEREVSGVEIGIFLVTRFVLICLCHSFVCRTALLGPSICNERGVSFFQKYRMFVSFELHYSRTAWKFLSFELH